MELLSSVATFVLNAILWVMIVVALGGLSRVAWELFLFGWNVIG